MPTKCASVEDAAELIKRGANIEIEIPSYLTIERFRTYFQRLMPRYEVKDAKHESNNVVYIKKG